MKGESGGRRRIVFERARGKGSGEMHIRGGERALREGGGKAGTIRRDNNGRGRRKEGKDGWKGKETPITRSSY